MPRLRAALLIAAAAALGGCSTRMAPVEVARMEARSTEADAFVREACDPVEESSGRRNLGPCVNTSAGQALPRLSPDGRRLYFIRLGSPEGSGGGEGVESIWVAERTSAGGWSTARELGSPFEARGNNFVLSVLPGGAGLLIGNRYSDDGRVEGGFSIVRREGAGWGSPEPLTIEGWHARGRWVSASLSEDGGVMVLHVEREGGHGGTDLYVSFRKGEGLWSEPLDLGPDLNTAGDEITPWLAADLRTLYFSSNGHGGLGGHDIFVTRRLDESWQRWEKPENLGPEFNTEGFDAYFVPGADGRSGYLASTTEALGSVDLFHVRKADPEPAPAVVAAVDPAPEAEPRPVPERPRVGETIVLRGVLFDFDRATLRSESEKTLRETIRVLEHYPDIRVEIQGHTDGMGSDSYNDRLSSARAEAVRDYLIEHGIAASRMEARGYGKRVPVATNETVEGRQQNRRVELRILETETSR